ncbi:uncharacterized protein LOC113214419 [Frankliniella occidentalis]|uniref:Uncharacterized protein LOC113214419 n=1 Tax=Frankliniella occidentalis TaxID=133901 RepID=A0A9C6WZX6_FRAOC|nr:uncharacterized protein LOC113214419 [Frankliniella occidentalis]
MYDVYNIYRALVSVYMAETGDPQVPPAPVPRRRGVFALVKWTDCKLGPCRDVVHQDKIVVDGAQDIIEEGQHRAVKCGKAETQRMCAERALKLLRVSPDGTVTEGGPCIPTRRECEHYHAVSTLREEAEAIADADAYDAILDDNASWDIAINPDQQAEPLKPDEGIISERVWTLDQVTAMAKNLPSNASAEDVRKILWSLPCLRQLDPVSEKPLVPGIPCFFNVHTSPPCIASTEEIRWDCRRALVPERVLALPHLTARGLCSPGTVGLPKPIFEAVKGN